MIYDCSEILGKQITVHVHVHHYLSYTCINLLNNKQTDGEWPPGGIESGETGKVDSFLGNIS